MRTLKYAILGLIYQQPRTGYDIAKEFKDQAFSNFWYATHSQIYPELKKLHEEGLINYDVVIQGEKMEKKQYTITPAGKKEFLEWLTQDEDLGITPKDIFRLRTYFSQFCPPEQFTHLLKSQIEKHSFRLCQLQQNRKDPLYKDCTPGCPEFGDYMVLEGAIIREKTYLIWLYRCLSYYGESIPKEYEQAVSGLLDDMTMPQL